MPYSDPKSGSLNAIARTLLAIVIGVIVWWVWTIVVATQALLAAVGTAFGSALEGFINTLYLMMILEVLVAAFFLITGGPVSALAWIGPRILAWQFHFH